MGDLYRFDVRRAVGIGRTSGAGPLAIEELAHAPFSVIEGYAGAGRQVLVDQLEA
jgi:hypothetical protein